MKLNIGRKLGLGFGLIVALLIVGSVNAVVGINRASDIVAEMKKQTEAAEAIHGFEFAAGDAFAWTVGYTVFEEAMGPAEIEGALAQAEREFEALALHIPGGDPTEIALIEEVGQVMEGLNSGVNSVIAAYERNPENTAKTVENLIALHHFLITELEPAERELAALLEAEVVGLHQAAAEQANSALLVSATLGVLATLLSVGAAWVISRGITGPATYLSGAAEAISRGDMDVTIDVKTGDEMQSLAESIDRMRASLKAAIVRLSA